MITLLFGLAYMAVVVFALIVAVYLSLVAAVVFPGLIRAVSGAFKRAGDPVPVRTAKRPENEK